MSAFTTERRPLGRKPTLEALMQEAIDDARLRTIEECAQEALAVVKAKPADQQPKIMRVLRDQLNELLGVRHPRPVSVTKPRKSSARERAEAVFDRGAA